MKGVDEIIPRESEVQNTLNKFADVIEDAVNFGSHILNWDTHKNNEGGDYNLAIALQFRHFLELIDSNSILVRYSSIDPSKLILRGMLETYFGLEYMLEKDSVDRAMAFLVCHAHQKLKTYKKLDYGSTENIEFKKQLDSDKSFENIDLSMIANIKAAIANSEAMLRLPMYEKAEKEYQLLKAAKIKNPNWYQFFGGPKNVRDLATHLKLNGLYEVLYRQWSSSTHSMDVIDGRLARAGNELAQIIQIRFVKDAQSVTAYSLTLSLRVFQLYIRNRIPDKIQDYKNWYSTIRNLYLEVASERQIIQITD